MSCRCEEGESRGDREAEKEKRGRTGEEKRTWRSSMNVKAAPTATLLSVNSDGSEPGFDVEAVAWLVCFFVDAIVRKGTVKV